MSDGADSSTTEVESQDDTAPVAASVQEFSPVTAATVPPPPAFQPQKVSALILFSGSEGSSKSLKFYLASVGFNVCTYDILDGEQYDLTDDAVWDPLLCRLRNREFTVAFISPPCGTFSRVRMLPGGPPVLRGVTGKERYGLPGLTPERGELVRKHNLLALRGIKAFQCMIDCGGVAVFEQPALRQGEVSMLRLDEFDQLLRTPGVGFNNALWF